MKLRIHPLVVVALVMAVCAGLILGIYRLRSSGEPTTADLLSHLPAGEGTVLFIDLHLLRDAGILDLLAGSAVAEEPEYKAFVLKTGFDYRTDLDSVLVFFHDETVYFLLQGEFDWPKLSAYATGEGGVCRNTFCRMDGSKPKRHISFFPLRPDLMALAVGEDSWAASGLLTRKEEAGLPVGVPEDPVWVYVPAIALQDNPSLPAGTRLFAKALEGAEQVLLSLTARDGRFEAVLDVKCRSIEDASMLRFQLEAITRVLQELIAREEKTPSPHDLSGVLAAGTFLHTDLRVQGRWPLERAFLEKLAGGSL